MLQSPLALLGSLIMRRFFILLIINFAELKSNSLIESLDKYQNEL